MENARLEFDKPSFSPGEFVTGYLYILVPNEGISTNFLNLNARGSVMCSWIEYEKKKEKDESGKTIKIREMQRFSAKLQYFNLEETIWRPKEGQPKLLPAGHHKIPFAFHLPQNCPPSFQSDTAHTEYKVIAYLEGIRRKTQRKFKIIPVLDLKTFLAPLSEMVEFAMPMTVTLPKLVYEPNELIPIQLEIHQEHLRKPSFLILARITETITYHASCGNRIKRKTESHEISNLFRRFEVLPEHPDVQILNLRIPKKCQSVKSEIISVDYKIEVKMGRRSEWDGRKSADFDVIIGKLPYTVEEPIEEEDLIRILHFFPPDYDESEEYQTQRITVEEDNPPGYSNDSQGLPPAYQEI